MQNDWFLDDVGQCIPNSRRSVSECEGIPDMVSFVCLIVGLVLLITGIVFYKILIQE